MGCLVESNATFIASGDERRAALGYKGGNIKCPHIERCGGNKEQCRFGEENFRRFYIEQTGKVVVESMMDKFYKKLEKHQKIVNNGRFSQ